MHTLNHLIQSAVFFANLVLILINLALMRKNSHDIAALRRANLASASERGRLV